MDIVGSYLMIAHAGRGQGRWQEPLPDAWPVQWKNRIDEWTNNQSKQISEALADSDVNAICALMGSLLRGILGRLYPAPSNENLMKMPDENPRGTTDAAMTA